MREYLETAACRKNVEFCVDKFSSADALDFIVKPVPPYAFQLKMTRALFRVARSASRPHYGAAERFPPQKKRQ